MLIKMLKSGDYALRGVDIVTLEAGELRDFGHAENSVMVEDGWAEWHQEKAKEVEAEEAPRRGRPRKSDD